MKKLIIVIFVIVFINLVLTIYVINKTQSVEADVHNRSDTTINHYRIDSIEFVISKRDSIIYNIKKYEKDMVEKVNNLDDSASWELFKRLVSE